MSEEKKLTTAFGAPDFIKERHAKHCYQCDSAYGEGVAKALGINIDFSDVK